MLQPPFPSKQQNGSAIDDTDDSNMADSQQEEPTDIHDNSNAESSDSEDDEMDERLKTLHNKEEIEMKYGITSEKVDFEAIERQGAQEYIRRLLHFLPPLLECFSTSEADEMILNFASDVCAGLC